MAAKGATLARIIDKAQYDRQHFIEVDEDKLPALAPSSVRIRTRVIGISSANLSYCANGTALHWWDCFPLPLSVLPAEYRDGGKYGVAPAWGFAEVIASAVSELSTGTMLWGLMPSHNCPADLQLRQSKQVPSDWLEVSEGREKVMSLYQRYVVVNEPFSPQNETGSLFKCAMGSIWGAGYVLNRFVFACPPDQPLHPNPDMQLPWSSNDANLKSAGVIMLAAGLRTSRAFVHQLVTNRPVGFGPKGLIEVTVSESSPLEGLELPFAHRVTGYDDVLSEDTGSWLDGLGVERIVIIDCGGGDGAVEGLTQHLQQQMHRCQIDVITVGTQPGVLTPAQARQRFEARRRLNSTMMNTSPIKDKAIDRLGEVRYFEQIDDAFQKVVQSELARNSDAVLGVKLDVRRGMRGSNGLERAWNELCSQKLHGSAGTVVWVCS